MERKIFGQQLFRVLEIGRDLTMAARKNYGNKRRWYNIQPYYICFAALISQDGFQLMSKTGVSCIFFRNVIYDMEDRKRSDIESWKLTRNLEMSFVSSGNSTKNFTSNWKSGENFQLLTSLLQMSVSIVDIQIVRNEEHNSFFYSTNECHGPSGSPEELI